MKIDFSIDARKDLERLKEFISNKNPKAAIRIVNELINGISSLLEFPDLGTRVKESPSPDSVRDIYVLDYHIRYLKLSKGIFLVRIWHQKEGRRIF